MGQNGIIGHSLLCKHIGTILAHTHSMPIPCDGEQEGTAVGVLQRVGGGAERKQRPHLGPGNFCAAYCGVICPSAGIFRGFFYPGSGIIGKHQRRMERPYLRPELLRTDFYLRNEVRYILCGFRGRYRLQLGTVVPEFPAGLRLTGGGGMKHCLNRLTVVAEILSVS